MPNSDDAATTPFSVGPQRELFSHQRQGYAGGEDHHAFKEFAGSGQSPDQPLHIGDGE
jgi:hypothetical protein